MRKLRNLVLVLACLASAPLWAQIADQGSSDPLGAVPSGESSIGMELQDANRTPAGRAAMAMSNSEYRVTPGDVYTLNFLTAGGTQTGSLIVDLEYNVSLSNIGSVAARGLTWRQFVTVVAEKVLKSYPLSAPQLIVNSVGIFPVFVLGEVRQTIEFQAWGLTRLSQAVAAARTAYTSIRAVRVVSADGSVRNYDLFQAERFGRMEQNPYLRPGDKVELLRADRIVSVAGAVRRPGTYQLLPRDGVRELLDLYGDGLAVDARSDRLDLRRKDTRRVATDGAIRFSLSDTSLPSLIDGDNLTVGNAADWLPVVYVEGAVLAANEGQGQRSIRVPLRAGDSIALLVRSVRTSLAPSADLRKTAIVRVGQAETIPVDLERLLYSTDPGPDILLREGDRIVIPAGAFEVFITGEVTKSAYQDVSSLTRLSALVAPFLTPYSSIRDIAIRDKSGAEKQLDLFRAQRYGEIEQDPYLKMGDTVVVARLERGVSLSGAVHRPGAYQLLPGEGLKELIGLYGDGLAVNARDDRLVLTRSDSKRLGSDGLIRFSLFDAVLPSLTDGDTVSVGSAVDYLPVVYVEGALVSADEGKGQRSIRVPLRAGETVGGLVRSVKTSLAPSADLRQSLVVRSGAPNSLPVDLEKLLYSTDQKGDFPLLEDDRIVIPAGAFEVFVTGEVTKSAYQDVSSLTRLSAFVAPFQTPYSSTRNIVIRDKSGVEKKFDLFRAQRYGEIEQDPYLKMGDTVVVPRLERIVTVQGAVERPGSYQLLTGETLKDLVETYASGFTDRADPNRLTVVRYVDAGNTAGEMQEIAYRDGLLSLNNRDYVTIHVTQDLLPVMFMEGAIAIGNQAGEVLEGSNRVVYQFYPGESLTHAVREKRALFGYLSDLENAYLERHGDMIPVDLRRYLFDKDFEDRIRLEANDTLIIPFKQAFVTVGGAVVAPGRYPHVPDRNWRYYVGLAGGIIAEKNSGEAVSILDKEDRPIGKNQYVPPEGKITAASNSFLYYFGIYAPIFTTVLSVITTTISVLAVTGTL